MNTETEMAVPKVTVTVRISARSSQNRNVPDLLWTYGESDVRYERLLEESDNEDAENEHSE